MQSHTVSWAERTWRWRSYYSGVDFACSLSAFANCEFGPNYLLIIWTLHDYNYLLFNTIFLTSKTLNLHIINALNVCQSTPFGIETQAPFKASVKHSSHTHNFARASARTNHTL